MKILMVSWSVLPSKGGSSIIVENLARNFTMDQFVVLGSRKLFQNLGVDRPKDEPQFHYFLSEIDLFGHGYKYFNWFRKLRFNSLITKIKALITEKNIDYVIGVYPNPFYCLAACRAARDLNIPFSSYFHNTYIENKAIVDPNAPMIQKEIFHYSKNIFVMSEGMKSYYESKYKLNKFIPLIHTFNQYPKSDSRVVSQGTPKKKYQIVALGNFNDSNIDATSRFIQAIQDHPSYELSIYTQISALMLKKRGLNTDKVKLMGFVHPDQVYDTLQKYDIMLLTHGFSGGYGEVEYQTIFPTRTIPLLLSGKPIFAHSPPGSFLNKFIQENECASLVDKPSTRAIIDSLDRLVSDFDYQSKLIKAAQKTVQKFYGPTVVKDWISILKTVQRV